MYRLLLLLSLFLPVATQAAVVINEIAWMGSVVGPNEEWIELYNNGSDPVSLDSWMLGDGVSLEIPLVGVIGAGAYALLERTDDDVVPNVTALLVYTGALSNDGRTLTLRRPDTSIEDQIAGGENWENIGGNNTTKETAQRSPSGWLTGISTPGKINVQKNSNSDITVENTQQSSAGGGGPATRIPVQKVVFQIPDTELLVDVEAPAVAYVNQKVTFEAIPSGIGKALMDSLVYTWSFGDTYAGSSSKPTHTFIFPGEYVVTVEAFYARHLTVARHRITVLPVTVSMLRTERGVIQIQNNAPYEMDLSGFVVRGDTEIVIPKNMILLPRGAVSITASRLESGSQKLLALYDTKKQMIASVMPANMETQNNSMTQSESVLYQSTREEVVVLQTPLNTAESIVATPAVAVAPQRVDTRIPIGNQSASVSSAATNPFTEKLPYIGLIGVILAGVLSLYIRRAPREEISDSGT